MLEQNNFLLSNGTKFASRKFTNICIFAESITDNGNLYKYLCGMIPKSPPYWNGRFCNGPVWADDYADYFMHNGVNVRNHALSGAVCYLKNPLRGFMPFTISNMVRLYKLKALKEDKANCLFIIWVGGNDYFQGMPEFDECTSKVVTVVEAIMEDLIRLGAVNFIIMNQPDYTITPADHVNHFQNLKELVLTHNRKQEVMIRKLHSKYPRTRIAHFDIFEYFRFVVFEMEEFNRINGTKLKNNTTPYWSKIFTRGVARDIDFHEYARNLRFDVESDWAGFNVPQAVAFLMGHPGIQEAAILDDKVRYGYHALTSKDPDEFVFWDRAHITRPIQKVMGQAMIKFTMDNFIPQKHKID